MADQVTQHNIGAMITGVTSVFPVSAGAETLSGVSIDRSKHNMPLSADMHTVVGADAGAPTGLSVVSTLQHSPDNATWTNYLPDGVNAATAAALTAASSENELAVDLAGAYRYIRIQTVISFTGGTSPTIEVAAWVTVGGEPALPSI